MTSQPRSGIVDGAGDPVTATTQQQGEVKDKETSNFDACNGRFKLTASYPVFGMFLINKPWKELLPIEWSQKKEAYRSQIAASVPSHICNGFRVLMPYTQSKSVFRNKHMDVHTKLMTSSSYHGGVSC